MPATTREKAVAAAKTIDFMVVALSQIDGHLAWQVECEGGYNEESVTVTE